MKEITKERVQKYTVYQAIDGTEFDFKEDCEAYDNSAKGVLRGKLKDLIVNDGYNGWDLMGGNEDNKILVISVPSQAAKDCNTTTGNICKCYRGDLLTCKEYIFLLDKNIDNRLQQLKNRKHKSKSENVRQLSLSCWG